MVIASFGNLVIKKLEIDPIVLVFYRQVFLDCKLLLLIKDFCKRRIISSLPILANNPNISNLAKQNNSFLSTILPKLEENNFWTPNPQTPQFQCLS